MLIRCFTSCVSCCLFCGSLPACMPVFPLRGGFVYLYFIWGSIVCSRVRSVPWAHRVCSRARSVPWAHRVCSRARSVPWAHRVCSRARSVPWARSAPWAHRVRSAPWTHRARSVPWVLRVYSSARSVKWTYRARSVPWAEGPESPFPPPLATPLPTRFVQIRWVSVLMGGGGH